MIETGVPSAMTQARPEILLADDSPDLSEALALLLEAEGFAVTTVGNGGALLLEILRRMQGPILVIADECMPLLRGLEVMDQVRRRGFVWPALLITAFDEQDVGAEARRLGVEVVPKPVDFDDLCLRVRRLTAPTHPQHPYGGDQS